MNTYLTIMVTVLVATQIIRVTQNHISLVKQRKKIEETCGWIKDNDISEKDFETQRKVFYLLHKKLTDEERQTPKMVEGNLCPTCGYTVLVGVEKYCPNCGQRLECSDE